MATAVIGSLQFGYNTGVINAPEQVSIFMSLKVDKELAVSMNGQ